MRKFLHVLLMLGLLLGFSASLAAPKPATAAAPRLVVFEGFYNQT